MPQVETTEIQSNERKINEEKEEALIMQKKAVVKMKRIKSAAKELDWKEECITEASENRPS